MRYCVLKACTEYIHDLRCEDKFSDIQIRILYRRLCGAINLSHKQIPNFTSFVSNFHPPLVFTSTVPDTCGNFLEISISIDTSFHSLSTSAFFKRTDSPLYLNISLFSHRSRKKSHLLFFVPLPPTPV